MSFSMLHSPAAVREARRRFFEQGEAPTGLLPEPLLRSWQRCAALGVPVDRSAAEPLTASELSPLRDRHDQLLRYTGPELDSLLETLDDTGSVVLLTDADGLILDARGDGSFLEKAARVALRPGVLWSEAQRGTNAIGTALAEVQLVEVWGAEHFQQHHKILCCTAAPIFDPFGRVAGLVDVSGDARLPPGYARGLVKRAAREVEYRWVSQVLPNLPRLRLHPEQRGLQSSQEGVLVLDGDRIVAANRVALHWLQAGPALLGADRRWPDWFLGPPPLAAGTVTTRTGLQLAARWEEPERRKAHRTPEAPATAAVRPADPQPSAACAGSPCFDPALERELGRVARLIDAGLPALITGETGSGKEIFARAAHAASRRAARPWVAVNCAAIPEGLIEAELFGYEEGAFTGARRKGASGRLREADGGVLFLDEIGDMPLALQARLLRVLQDREVVPLGGGKPVKVDFVPLCATHRDLQQAVAAGQFREDLYYRLAHYTVALPPLRHRSDRAACIAALWQATGASERGVTLGADALAALDRAPWPGNLRQLAGVLQTLAVLADPGAVIDLEDLPPELRGSAGGATPATVADGDTSLAALTEDAITAALARHGGNVSAAARTLGVHRSTLYRRRV